MRAVRINPEGTPGWVTVNIAATWQSGERWQAEARLENILDKRYRLHGSGIDSTGWNLLLSLLDVYGIHRESFGDSTGRLEGLLA